MFLQLEQEIDLILDRKGVFASALQSWSSKWVPAIKEYASTLSGKKAELVAEAQRECRGDCCFLFPFVCLLLFSFADSVGGDDKLALHLLCKILSKRSSGENLVYIYEECEV